VGRRSGGYQVGNFTIHVDHGTASVRDSYECLWRGQTAIASVRNSDSPGSAPICTNQDGRRPAGLDKNFITAHDAFTHGDLVSYNDKHNEANLEDKFATDRRTNGTGELRSPTGTTRSTGFQTAPGAQPTTATFLATLILSQGGLDACRRRTNSAAPGGQQRLVPGLGGSPG